MLCMQRRLGAAVVEKADGVVPGLIQSEEEMDAELQQKLRDEEVAELEAQMDRDEARAQARDADDLDSLGSDEPPPLDALLRVTDAPGAVPPADGAPWPGACVMPREEATADTLMFQ